ncbi:diaminopropionate ammonia-lyase, partial [Burkholderia ubonensis]|uniref:diaminopropionate ammonia-lyase n=1 Tax=Burkholderia ubonensis TaxID=101571 RepID=UPI000A9FF811
KPPSCLPEVGQVYFGEVGHFYIGANTYDGYEAIPRDVMQGYGVIAAELVGQAADTPGAPAFTHVLLQGGVGGLAAGVASYLWERHGARRPHFIVVEPRQADCLYQSALAGRATKATGAVDSVMAGLACGEASPLAWDFLEPCIDHFMLIDDDDAVRTMRRFAAGTGRDAPLVIGESGAAGLAGLAALMRDPEQARAARLDATSRVLAISTEGATAPSVYRQCVGESAEAVLARQRDWLDRTASAVAV